MMIRMKIMRIMGGDGNYGKDGRYGDLGE